MSETLKRWSKLMTAHDLRVAPGRVNCTPFRFQPLLYSATLTQCSPIHAVELASFTIRDPGSGEGTGFDLHHFVVHLDAPRLDFGTSIVVEVLAPCLDSRLAGTLSTY